MLEAAGKDRISDCSCGSYPSKYPKPWVYDCVRDPHPDWPILKMNTVVCPQGNKSLLLVCLWAVCVLVYVCMCVYRCT